MGSARVPGTRSAPRPNRYLEVPIRRRSGQAVCFHGKIACYIAFMRYLVKARVKPGKECALAGAIENKTLGKGSIAGDEYLSDMEQARINEKGVAQWVETCFCHPPLAEERPYWKEYFDLLSVKDAHSRRNCRHENGTEPWACCECDCTQKLEEKLRTQGMSFLNTLRSQKSEF
jgi:hypothetical protein